MLGALGRYEEARAIGSRYLGDAEREGLTHSVVHIKLPLAIAHAALQEREAAEALTTSVLEYLEQIGARGLNLGLAYEARARVARLVGDRATFDAYAARCGEILGKHGNRTLIAKHHRLTREGQANDGLAADGPSAAAMLLTANAAATHMTAALSACPGPRERARLGLDLLVARSGALGGFLFAIESTGPMLVAQSGLDEPPTGLTLAVAEHLRTDLHDAVDTTDVASDVSADQDGAESPVNAFAWLASAGRALRPTMLGHRSARGYEITGLAVLVVDPSTPFIEPSDVAAHISRAWFDLGEVGSLTTWLSAFKTE